MRSVNTKLAFSALGVALLAAAPAFAESPYRQSLAQQNGRLEIPASNDVVIHDRVVGRDPDLRIRSELSRDADSLRGE
jgi:hypothetical protein